MLAANPMRVTAHLASVVLLVLGPACATSTERVQKLENRVQELSVDASATKTDVMLTNDGLSRTNVRLQKLSEQLDRLSRPAVSQKLETSLQENAELKAQLKEVQGRLDALGQRVAALQAPEPLQRGPHGFAEDTLRFANERAKAGDFREARRLYAELLATWPESELGREAHHGLAETYFSQGDCPHALPEYEVVIRKYPEATSTATAYLRTADCFVELKRTPEAKLALETLTRRFPESAAGKAAKQRIADLENKPVFWR